MQKFNALVQIADELTEGRLDRLPVQNLAIALWWLGHWTTALALLCAAIEAQAIDPRTLILDTNR